MSSYYAKPEQALRKAQGESAVLLTARSKVIAFPFVPDLLKVNKPVTAQKTLFNLLSNKRGRSFQVRRTALLCVPVADDELQITVLLSSDSQ